MSNAIPNHALRQLRAGKLAIGMGVNQARTVGIATLAKTAGFDWLFIDCEHNSMDMDTAAQIAERARALSITNAQLQKQLTKVRDSMDALAWRIRMLEEANRLLAEKKR